MTLASTLKRTLRVTEIFHSIQGETSRSGLPTVFIRLTGCPLRCAYCDTEYAFYGGKAMSLVEICDQVKTHRTRYVTVTGGEPLAQEPCLALLEMLCDREYAVSLETSGALDVSPVDVRVSKILDIKTPGSGECEKNLWGNLEHLRISDEIKFVICDETDYRWARNIVHNRKLDDICPILFSPVHGRLDSAILAEWVLRDELPVRLQIQLHKILWGEVAGR